MRLFIVTIVVVVASHASDATAQSWRKFQGGAYLHYELTGWSAIEEEPMTTPRSTELVLAGARLHGFVARNKHVAYHIGMDLFAGSTIRESGFAYDVALFPIGAMLRLGTTSVIGLAAGIGANGAMGTLDDAVVLPVEMVAELGLHKRVRLLGRARVSFLGKTGGARQSGAPSLPAGDELEAMLGLRFGKGERKYRAAYGFGYFLAASYREQQDAKLVGVTIGFSIDMASDPRGSGDW